MDLRELVGSHLRSATCGWSIGAYGAIAEFHRDPAEPAQIDGLCVATPRGAIAVELPPGCRAFGDERVVVLGLAGAEARMSARAGIACLGADRDALRAQDRDALLFDLGLGLAHCEFCVRTADAALVDALRAAEGMPLLENAPLVERLKRASPHRVVRSRAGRIEVFQDIAPDGGRSPEGPHTHLLPRLLRRARTRAANPPMPDGWLPCIALYPLKSVHEVL
jgi:uncharacterized protein DUF6925